MTEVLTVLERFVGELGEPLYGNGEPLHFAAAQVPVDPILPHDLFGYIGFDPLARTDQS